MADNISVKLISATHDDDSYKYNLSIEGKFTWDICIELANIFVNNDLYQIKLLQSSNGEGEEDFDHLNELKYVGSLFECESLYKQKKALCIGALSLEFGCRIQIIWYLDSKEITVYTNKGIEDRVVGYFEKPLKKIIDPKISSEKNSGSGNIPTSPRSVFGPDPTKSSSSPKGKVAATNATTSAKTPPITNRTSPSATARQAARTSVQEQKLIDSPEVKLFEERVKAMTSLIFVAFMIVFVLALVSSMVIAAFFNAQGDFNFGLITLSGIMFLFTMIITGIVLKIVDATPSRVHLTKIFKSIGTETAWITIVAVYSVFLYTFIYKNSHGDHTGIIYHIANIAFLIAILFPFFKTIFLIRKEHNEKYPHDKIKRIYFQDFFTLFFNGIRDNPSDYLVTYNKKDYLANKYESKFILYSLDPIDSNSEKAETGYNTPVKLENISEVNTFKVFAVFNNHKYEVSILDSFTLTSLLLKAELNHPVFKNAHFQRFKDHCTFNTTIDKISKIYIYKKTVNKDSLK